MKTRSLARLLFLATSMVGLSACSHHETADKPTANAGLKIFYVHPNGDVLTPYRVAEGNATDSESLAYLATVSVLNGPPAGVSAIRFPLGTTARSVHVEDSTATVDLSKNIEQTAPGGVSEAGEFKALVWTLTDIPGITRVRIRVDGSIVPTLPGGHFELDEPLSRKDW
jgi:spore germination protein GerM